ncbi:MAG: hypothetical protein RIS20_1998 [Bacteroidota bacterium]|jgi:hypothetical protein
MKKTTLIVSAIIWMIFLVILINALTDVFPGNIFQNYKLVVGFAFITVTGLIRMVNKKLITPNRD